MTKWFWLLAIAVGLWTPMKVAAVFLHVPAGPVLSEINSILGYGFCCYFLGVETVKSRRR